MIRSTDRSWVIYCRSMEFPKRSFKRKVYVCRYVRWIPSVHEVEVSRGVRKIDDAFPSKRVGAWLDLQTAGLFTCQRQPGEIVVSWKRHSRGPTNNPTANASVARWADRFDSRAIERVWIYVKAVTIFLGCKIVFVSYKYMSFFSFEFFNYIGQASKFILFCC